MPTKHIKKDTYVAVQQKLVKVCTNEGIYINEAKFLDALINKGLEAIKPEDFNKPNAHIVTRVGG